MSKITKKLKLYWNGGLTLTETALAKILGNGTEHWNWKAETLIRFMQRYRNPSSRLLEGQQLTRALERVRRLMDSSSTTPLWISRVPVSLSSVSAEWFVPPGCSVPSAENAAASTIIYFHGGGYENHLLIFIIYLSFFFMTNFLFLILILFIFDFDFFIYFGFWIF